MGFFKDFFEKEGSPRKSDYNQVDNLLDGLRCIYGVYPNVSRCERGGCKGGRSYHLTCPTYSEYRRRLIAAL